MIKSDTRIYIILYESTNSEVEYLYSPIPEGISRWQTETKSGLRFVEGRTDINGLSYLKEIKYIL